MRSKSWLIILVIGIVGICGLGLLTKVALESNPTLLKIGKLKQAIAQDFGSQGVREVAVKSLPRQRGFEIRLEAPRKEGADPAALAQGVAETFLRSYPGPAPFALRLTLVQPARFGCSGPSVYFEKEYVLAELVAEVELRAALSRMEESLASAGFRLRGDLKAEPLRVTAEIAPPKNEAEEARASALFRAKAQEHLGAGRARSVKLSLYTSEKPPRLLWEELVERPAARRRVEQGPGRR